MTNSVGRILSLFLVSHSVASVVSAPVSAPPVGPNDPVVARVGDHVTLRCSTEPREDKCLGWTYYPPSYDSLGDGDKELSYCGEVYINRNGRIAVETGNVSVLSITDIQSEDAGQYKCISRDDDEEEISSKELIVIDDGPKCSSTAHKDLDNKASQAWNKMELHCEVGFNGSLNATNQCILEWRIVGRKGALDSSKCIVGDNSVKATLTLDAASHGNDASYVCVVRGSDVKQYSCETGQIETPLTGPMETPLTTHEDVALLSTDPHFSALSDLQVEQSTDQQTVNDRTSLSDHLTQPPSTQQFDVVQPQIHDIPQQMSEIVQVQKELLVVEKERLRLEKEKIAMMATMAASRLEKDMKEK